MKQVNKLPKLTIKQSNFVAELLKDKKISATQAVRNTYNVESINGASQIATDNLRNPKILQHLQANSVRAESVIVDLLEDKKSEVRLASAKDILDRVHGKATQRIEQTTTGVTLTIDLTSALNDSE